MDPRGGQLPSIGHMQNIEFMSFNDPLPTHLPHLLNQPIYPQDMAQRLPPQVFAQEEPAAKRPKTLEAFDSDMVHHLPPSPSSNSPTPPSSTTNDSKSKDSAPKKKSGARTKKLTDSSTPSPSTTTKKADPSTNVSFTPLRSDNKAKLEAMGLSWTLPRYQPYPTQHPFKMGWSKPNSSSRLQFHHDLAANPRGYNLSRSSYPTQEGKWYYEVLILSAPELLQKLQSHDQQPSDGTSNAKKHPHDSSSSKTVPETSSVSGTENLPLEASAAVNDASMLVIAPTESSSSVPTSIDASVPQEDPPAHHEPIFPDFDLNLFISATTMLSDMAHVPGPYKVTLPSPRWRLGWATEQADREAPTGTDVYGFSWRDDGTLFHQARPVSLLVAQNLEMKEHGEADKILTSPDLELLEDLADPEAEPKLDSYGPGDVLGFAIELPRSNMDFIRALHEHQEAILVNQSTELQLRREVLAKQTALNYPQANQAQLRAEIEALLVQVAEIKPVPPLNLPPSEPGTRMTFYKNGKLQNLALLNVPPGSYYPAASLYYQAAVLANFGPTFAHPPPNGFLPTSELPNHYQIPLPASQHFPLPPP